MHSGKKAAAVAALTHVEEGSLLGVGTGSTVNVFIELLAASGIKLAGCVASSVATAKLLEKHHFNVMDLNQTGQLELYIDGADEVNPQLQLIKGGGGALTREKIIAGASREFVCIVDKSKEVDVLGDFALPVEIIPMARSVDCYGLTISNAVALEAEINAIPGVVTNGLFARRAADTLITGHDTGEASSRKA